MELVGDLTQRVDFGDELVVETGECWKYRVLDFVHFSNELLVFNFGATFRKFKPVVIKVYVDIYLRLGLVCWQNISPQFLQSRGQLRLIE